MKTWKKVTQLFGRKRYAEGGHLGDPPTEKTRKDVLKLCALTPGELLHHPDGTTHIVNNDGTCSEVIRHEDMISPGQLCDNEHVTRLAEYLHDEDRGETITEHEEWCRMYQCLVRAHYEQDALRIIAVLLGQEPARNN